MERFEDAISRARFVPELADLAGEIEVRVERGRLDLARDPARIEEAISMLNGTQRAQVLARRRLEEAGEYAIPDMLRQITEGPDERLKLACESMIRQIGRQAVTPLCAALGGLDPVSRRIVCDVLGEIGWPHAAPFLREVSLDQTASGPVRETVWSLGSARLGSARLGSARFLLSPASIQVTEGLEAPLGRFEACFT